MLTINTSGPYNLIKTSRANDEGRIKRTAVLRISDPYIEIYGHWTNDETKLETELLMCLK
ncbi:MAG: hypothetical protein WDO19_05270 [Bacteroidota bacterium]